MLHFTRMIGAFLRAFAVLLVLAAIAVGFVLWKSDPVVIAFKERPLDTLESAYVIKHPQTRQAVFGRLDRKGDVDYFTFTVTRGTPIRFSVKTPVADKAFSPDLTLFGPGLPALTGSPIIPIGDMNGAVVGHVLTDKRTAAFDMPTLTTWYLGPTVAMTAPQDGTYALAITSPDGKTGRYALQMGGTPDRSMDAISSYAAGTIRAILRLY